MGKRRVAKQQPQQQDQQPRLLPRNSTRRVAVVFVALLALLLPLAMFSGDWTGWRVITSETAAATSSLVRLLGVRAVASGSLIHLPTRTLAIDPGCTAVNLLAVYVALVLAYPIGWKPRALGVLVGSLAIISANILRLVAVAFMSGLLNAKMFAIVHDYLFEFGMAFMVLMLWVVWLGYAKRTA